MHSFLMKCRDKKNLYPLYAFFLTGVLYLCILGCRHILGYDNLTVLSGDLYTQYVSFIRLFLRKLLNGSDFWYSFSLYYGNPTSSTFAYYCFSPFNLIYLLPGISTSAATILLIFCKLSLAAACFTLFLQKALKREQAYTILFGSAYALCTFAVTMEIHIMWLDALYILPILMLFLIRFTRGKSFLPLVPVYAYLFLTNFYMGYIVGIFSALCFIALLILQTESFKKAAVLKAVKQAALFALSVLLAAGSTAILLLPAASELLQQRSEGGDSFRLVSITIPDIVNNLFLGEMQGMGSPVPLLYCGLPVLFLLPVYFFSKNISKKEKIVAGGIFIFYIASAHFLPLYRFLHAFESPNWYAHRYAFCIVFLLLTLCCRGLEDLFAISGKTAGIYTAALLLFYSLMIPFQELHLNGYNTNTHGWFLCNALFLSIYLALFLLQNKESLKKHMPLLLTAVFSAELLLNGWNSLSNNQFGFFSEEEINGWEQKEAPLIAAAAKDPTPGRVRMMKELSFNAPAYFGYMGLNTFTTTDQTKLRSTLAGLGIATSFMSIYDQGYTDLMDMIFSVRYVANPATNTLYSNPHALPIAFMSSPNVIGWRPNGDCFMQQQDLIAGLTGNEYSFFTPIPLEEVNVVTKNMTVTPYDDCVVFQHESDLSKNGKVTLSFPGYEGKIVLAQFLPSQTPNLQPSAPEVFGIDGGYQKAANLSDGSIVTARISADTATPVLDLYFSKGAYYDYVIQNMYFYAYDASALQEVYDILSERALNITGFSDGYLEGDVLSTEDHPVLFTSIPYDAGWEATVDGVPVKALTTLDGTFLALYLSPGAHHVAFHYAPPLSFAATMISSFSILLVLVLVMIRQRKGARK